MPVYLVIASNKPQDFESIVNVKIDQHERLKIEPKIPSLALKSGAFLFSVSGPLWRPLISPQCAE